MDARVADVDAVEEAEHVEDRHDGDAVPVDFAPDGALFFVGPGELGERGVGGGGVFAGLLVVHGWVVGVSEIFIRLDEMGWDEM